MAVKFLQKQSTEIKLNCTVTHLATLASVKTGIIIIGLCRLELSAYTEPTVFDYCLQISY